MNFEKIKIDSRTKEVEQLSKVMLDQLFNITMEKELESIYEFNQFASEENFIKDFLLIISVIGINIIILR